MASSKLPLCLLLLAVLAAAAGVPTAAAQEHYCGEVLSGLLSCHAFMYEGAPTASPTCCAAYDAALSVDAFCLCYIVNGVYGRATGYNVNVTRALEIPTSCGEVAPPVEFCNMPGVVLAPYERPEGKGKPAAQSPSASSSVAQPPSGSAMPPTSPQDPSFTPPPASAADRRSTLHTALFLLSGACAAAAMF